MGRFKGRHDSFLPGQFRKGVERLFIGNRNVFGPACVLQPGVFRADTRIGEAGGDGMGMADLTEPILEEVGLVAMEDPDGTGAERRRMLPLIDAKAGSLHSDHSDCVIIEARIE